nr:MAG TPA: BNR/Asp-box repeat protein [Caudoviricetes sp.]
MYQKKGQWLYEGKVIFITSDGGLTKWIYIRY